MPYRRPLLLHLGGCRKSIANALRWYLTSLIVLSVGVHALASATDPAKPWYPQRFVPEVWRSEQGLPENWVTGIAQDKEGYLWVSTFGGLARFDGARFRVFGPTDMPGVPGYRILSVFESHAGDLWIGTADHGATRVHDGVATNYDERSGLPSKFIKSIADDGEGNIWINTARGIARFDGTTVGPYATHAGKPVTEFLLQGHDRSMWFRSEKNILRFGADGSTSQLPGAGTYLLQEDRDGSVWITFNNSSRVVRYWRGTFSEIKLPQATRRRWSGAFPQQGVVAMARGTDGELLMLTASGLVRARDGKLNGPETLPEVGERGEVVKVNSLIVDREGNLWLGTAGLGLVRLRPAPLTAFAKNEGLTDSQFRSVFQDREGRIWLGGDSLYWFDGHELHLFPGLADIRAITQTRDGDLWFGGSGGLYRWRSGALTRFKIDAPAVIQILQDVDGTIWIIAAGYDRPGGFYRFRDGTFERMGTDANTRVIGDPQGGLWVASRDGLRRIRGDSNTVYKYTLGSVTEILQDASRTIWIAGYGAGLFRFRDGQFSAITTRDGLPNDRLVGAVKDDKGNLWVSSDQNIFRLSLEELNDFADGKISSISPVSYGIAEGMRNSECNAGGPAAWRTRDGRLWFATMRGVVAIDPSAGNRLVPPVILEDARASGASLTRDGRTSLSPGNNNFDFRFTALSLSAPEKVRFKYRLDPYDKDWIDAGNQRTARYMNMVPGRYSFRVIAASNYGIWNNDGASVEFVLRPHFYETNWFRSICALVFVALLWAAYQWRVRYLHHQFELTLDARVNERTRIARELHDSLLQSAHGVLLRFQTVAHLLPERAAEAKEMLDSAIEQTSKFITEARDEVQGLRESTVQNNDLAVAISTLGEELNTGSSAGRPDFDVAVEGRARNLHPIVRDEVYKIAAEALRNASRHAQAKKIEVELRYDHEQFRLRVRDDGKGIDPAVLSRQEPTGHFGLPGMRERAPIIGGDLTVWSEVDAGTEVELRVPAGKAYAKSREDSWWSRKFSAKA